MQRVDAQAFNAREIQLELNANNMKEIDAMAFKILIQRYFPRTFNSLKS